MCGSSPIKDKSVKRQEILNWISKKLESEKADLFDINKDYVMKIFKDDTYDEDRVEELIDELVEEDLLSEIDISMKILVSKKLENKIRGKYKELLYTFTFNTGFFIISLITLIIIFILKKEIFSYAIMICVGLFIGFHLLKFFADFLRNRVLSILNIDFRLLGISSATTIIAITIGYFYSNYIDEKFGTGSLLAAISLGIVLGYLFNKILFKPKVITETK